ncbi:unnamed protein product [Ceutorhynchus assimilis]|uniref:Nose resistant-to-fluoxetine protein N-terminal domain-containing protein n=1 Tax=Ceutorhynchus assimilis TaxID=467358 RepID=A0A9N9QKU8_9CUCU|nr:unnamed protein product [Ceutorhynchus assimilis]
MRAKMILVQFFVFVSLISLISAFKSNFDLSPLNLDINYEGEDIDVSNFYLQFLCGGDFTTRNVSDACTNQMQAVCDNREILLEMSDAWSKLPYTGMIRSTKQDWGSFDQCINIDYQPPIGLRVLGKYCLNGIAIPTEIRPNLTINDVYLLSYCVPDSCSASDLANLIFNASSQTIISNLINDIYCSTKESDSTIDTSGIIVAVIFCFLLLISTLATALDVLSHTGQLKIKHPSLTAFSLFTNGRKLSQITYTNGSSDQILVIHGLKVISMMWIMAAHAAGAFGVLPIFNEDEGKQFQTKSYSVYLQAAYLGVDTFFFISGFLLAFQYFKGPAKKPLIVQVASLPGIALHRYLRVTPVVLMFYLFTTFLMKYIGSGPLKPAISTYYTEPCKENWWAVFLYIQNYYNPTDLCWTHLWYLSADWQLFLIGLVIMVAMAWQLKRNFKHLMMGMAVLNGLFLLLPIYSKLQFPDFDEMNEEYDTHSKLVTYFMGVTLGCYLRTQKDKPYFFRKGWNISMWLLSLITLFACTIVLNEVKIQTDSQLSRALLVLVKPFWCLGLGFILYSCSHGYGGVVNWCLTAGWMQVVSRLTFCMYILHLPVIMLWVVSKRGRDHFSDYTMFYYFCGHLIVTMIVSAIWTLMFESPFIAIERLVFGGSRKPRQNRELGNSAGIPPPPPLEPGSEKITIVHKQPY